MARKRRRKSRRKRVTFRARGKKISFMARRKPKRRTRGIWKSIPIKPVLIRKGTSIPLELIPRKFGGTALPKIHETRRSYRVRLHKPTKKRYGRFRTIPLGREGLRGVIGIRKGKHRKRGRPRKGRRGVSELQSIIVPREINGLYARKIARRVKRRTIGQWWNNLTIRQRFRELKKAVITRPAKWRKTHLRAMKEKLNVYSYRRWGQLPEWAKKAVRRKRRR